MNKKTAIFLIVSTKSFR